SSDAGTRSARARPTSTAKVRRSSAPCRPTHTTQQAEPRFQRVALAIRGNHLATEEAHVLRIRAAPEAHDAAADAEGPVALDAGADLVGSAGQGELGAPLEEGELVEHRLRSSGGVGAVERDGRERLLRDQDVRRVAPYGPAMRAQDLPLARDLGMIHAQVVPDVGVAGDQPEEHAPPPPAGPDPSPRPRRPRLPAPPRPARSPP